MITTNVVLSERPIYAFYRSLAEYLCYEILPYPLQWFTIEGFWPGFQLRRQEALSNQVTIVADDMRLALKPQNIELEERLNHPWRIDSPMTNMLARNFIPPIFAHEDFTIHLKFIRVKGTFEIDIYSTSPLFSNDALLHILTRFNNRYTYVPLVDYPLIIPFRVIDDVNPDWWSILSVDPKVTYAYLGATGEQHYYFTVPTKPMIRTIGPSYSMQEAESFIVTVPCEFNTALPTLWIIWGPSLVENIRVHMTYGDLDKQEYMAAMVDFDELGFIPRGWIVIPSESTNVVITSPKEPTHFKTIYVENTGVYEVSASFSTSKVSNTKYSITVDITESSYLNDPTLFNTQPIYFYWGY